MSINVVPSIQVKSVYPTVDDLLQIVEDDETNEKSQIFDKIMKFDFTIQLDYIHEGKTISVTGVPTDVNIGFMMTPGNYINHKRTSTGNDDLCNEVEMSVSTYDLTKVFGSHDNISIDKLRDTFTKKKIKEVNVDYTFNSELTDSIKLALTEYCLRNKLSYDIIGAGDTFGVSFTISDINYFV